MTMLTKNPWIVAGALILLSPVAVQAQNPLQSTTKELQAFPSLAPLVESVKAAVVNVDVQARAEMNGPYRSTEFEDPFEQFFGGGRRPRGRELIRQGTGSGFIVDPKGLVLTNNHVVEGAISIRVRLDDGRTFDGQVLGGDHISDVALVKLKGKIENLPTVKLGDSDAMKVGDWVLAIGNPFGLASSVSLGIISARARNIHASPYDDFLQTDAAINPGNSGGPLFNMKGEVIGINTAIASGGAGIGFAVPSDIAKSLLPQLETNGSVTRGWLGIVRQNLTPDLAKALNVPVNEGAVVVGVNDGSPAKKGGLKEDDVITAIDGEKIRSDNALSRAIALKRPGSQVTLSIYRGGKPQTIKVTLGTRPDLEQFGTKPVRDGQSDERKQRVGLSLEDMTPRLAQGTGLPPQGSLIADVVPGSPAERAELARGMVIVEVNHSPVRGRDELIRVIKSSKPGSTLLLRVRFPNGGSALKVLQLPE